MLLFFVSLASISTIVEKKKGNEMKKLFVICKVRQLYNVLSITNITVETKMIYVYELIPAVKAKPVSFC